MRAFLHSALLLLGVAAALSVGRPVEPFSRSIQEFVAAPGVTVGGGVATDDIVGAARTVARAVLQSGPVTLELPGRSNWGPWRHGGGQGRRALTPVAAPALTATRARAATASHLDFIAEFVAVRAGALSARTTCIPPPSHA